MSQEEFGYFNYWISIVGVMGFLNLGLYVGQSKLFHDYSDTEKKGELLFTIYATLFVFLLGLFIILYLFKLDIKLFSLLVKNTASTDFPRLTLLMVIFIGVISFMLMNFLVTSEQIRKIQKYNLLRLFLVNIFSIGALYLIKNDAITRLRAAFFIEGILFLYFVKYLLRYMVYSYNIAILKKSFLLGLPILLNAIYGIFTNFSDKYFLEKYGTYTDLSIYYLAFSIASIIQFAFVSLQNVWLPLFFKEKDFNINKSRTISLMKKISVVFVIFFIIVMLGTKVLLVMNIVPSKYSEVIKVLPIVLFTQLMIGFTSLMGNFLIAFEKTISIVYIGLIVSGISVVCNMYLVPRFNIYGAALGSLIVNTAYFGFFYAYSLYYYKKKNGK